jgi:hypothetical protein
MMIDVFPMYISFEIFQHRKKDPIMMFYLTRGLFLKERKENDDLCLKDFFLF